MATREREKGEKRKKKRQGSKLGDELSREGQLKAPIVDFDLTVPVEDRQPRLDTTGAAKHPGGFDR